MPMGSTDDNGNGNGNGSRANALAEAIKNAYPVESSSGKKFLKLPKLDDNNYIFSNNFHGYESGVLLYKKSINGVVEDGVLIDMSVFNKTEYYTYLNGMKVGVYVDDEGGFMLSEAPVRSAGLQTRKDSKDSTIYSYYFSYDGQGNVQVSNKAGQLPYSLYAYDSYGAETGGEGDPNLASYKGYDKGPFGYKTGVRQYDPETGRFLSPDPFKGYMTDPASQHPYMYCRGNPVNYADPSGYDDIYILYGKGRKRYDRKLIENLKAGEKNTVVEQDLSVGGLRIALKNADYIAIVAHATASKKDFQLLYINNFQDAEGKIIWSDKLSEIISFTSNIRAKLIFADFCCSGNFSKYGASNMKNLKDTCYIGYSRPANDTHRWMNIVKSQIGGSSLKKSLKKYPPVSTTYPKIKYIKYP